MKVGVVTLVMLSVLETPLSDAAIRSGRLGAAGAVVSMVTTSAGDAILALPATSVCFAVTVCAPVASVALLIDQLPERSTVPVPSTVVPLVSNRVTTAPTSPVPVKVGVVTLVRLSVLDVPLSDAVVRSGAPGAAAMVSMVTTSGAEAALVMPPIVCLAVIVCVPSASVELGMDQLPEASAAAEPSAVVPLVSNSVTVAPATAVPVKVGATTLVMLSTEDAPVSDAVSRSGAPAAATVASMVTISPADGELRLPAISVCIAVTV